MNESKRIVAGKTGRAQIALVVLALILMSFVVLASVTDTDSDNYVYNPNYTQYVEYHPYAPADSPFIGWKVGDSEGIHLPGEWIEIAGDTTLTAQYGSGYGPYLIRFESNGGSGSMIGQRNISGIYVLPDSTFASPEGKAFVGWSVKIGSAEPVIKMPGERIVVSDNTIVKALWDARVSSTVSFNNGGGEGSMSSDTAAGMYTLPTNGFTAPEGKAFVGWSVAGDLKNPGDRIDIAANTEVIAIWGILSNTITFAAGIGSGTMVSGSSSSSYCLPDSSFTVPANSNHSVTADDFTAAPSSVIVGYQGIASTEYNPEYWADSSNVVFTKNVVSGSNTDNWEGPTVKVKTKIQFVLKLSGSSGSYTINIPSTFESKYTFSNLYYFNPDEPATSSDPIKGQQLEVPNEGSGPIHYSYSAGNPVVLTYTWNSSFNNKVIVEFTENVANTNVKMVFGGWSPTNSYGDIVLPGDVIDPQTGKGTLDNPMQMYAMWIVPDTFTENVEINKTLSSASVTIDLGSEEPATTSYWNLKFFTNNSDSRKGKVDLRLGGLSNCITYGYNGKPEGNTQRTEASMFGTIYLMDADHSRNGYFYFDINVLASYNTNKKYLDNYDANCVPYADKVPAGTFRSLPLSSGLLANVSFSNADSPRLCGDVIFDNIRLSSGGTKGIHGNSPNGAIYANGHTLIMGVSINNTATGDRQNFPQIFGAGLGASESVTAPTAIRDIVYGQEGYSIENVNLGTRLIIHSGIYANVIGGGYNDSVVGSTSNPLSTYIVMRGGTVLDTLAGGNGGQNGSNNPGTIYGFWDTNEAKTKSQADAKYGQVGGTFVYLLGEAFMAGDDWQDSMSEVDISSTNHIYKPNRSTYSLTESTVLEGGSSIGKSAAVKSSIFGSTHVFLSGNASVFDVQGGGRTNFTYVDYSYVEVTGDATVRHVACGTITDGNKEKTNMDCVGSTEIYVGGNALVANVFGAGYDTWDYPYGNSMMNGNIRVKIDGGYAGNVYGGGYRGSIGSDNYKTDGNKVNIQIDITGGVVDNVYGGGSGGVNKVHHSSDGTLADLKDQYKPSMGKSYVNGDITINITNGIIRNNVYGGGMSVPKLESYKSYEGEGGSLFINSFGETVTYVASVRGNVTINISGENTEIDGSVYGAGRGIEASLIDDEWVFQDMTKSHILKSDASFIDIDWFLVKNGSQQWVETAPVYVDSLFDNSKDLSYYTFARVLGDVNITISGGAHIKQDVYGGGSQGKLIKDANYGFEGSTTLVLDHAIVDRDVFGGGLGRDDICSVEGDRGVYVKDSRITGSVYGGSSIGDDGKDHTKLESDAKVTVESGSMAAVFGGGFMGRTWGSTTVEVGYKITIDGQGNIITEPDTAGGKEITVVDIYAGGNIKSGDELSGGNSNSSPTSISEPLVQGNGSVYIFGSSGQSDISISGSVMGSGNSCETKGDTSILIENLDNRTPMAGLHRSDKLTVSHSSLTITGRSSIEPVDGVVKIVSLFKIGEFNIKNDSSIVLISPAEYVKELNSLNRDNDFTTSSSPSNAIIFGTGVTFYIRGEYEDSSGDPEIRYGTVKGYTVMSVQGQSSYGAYVLGSSQGSTGGFVIEVNGVTRLADTSLFSTGVKCWFISGTATKVMTLSIDDTGQSVEASIDITKMQNGTDMMYVGTTYVSSGSSEDYKFVRPGTEEPGDEGQGSNEFGLLIGTKKEGDKSPTIYDMTRRYLNIDDKGDEWLNGTYYVKNAEFSSEPIEGSEGSGERVQKRLYPLELGMVNTQESKPAGNYKLNMLFTGQPFKDRTQYLGYVIIHLEEISTITYTAEDEHGVQREYTNTTIANNIEIRVELYSISTGDIHKPSAYSITMKTEDGGDGAFKGMVEAIIPAGYIKGQLMITDVIPRNLTPGYTIAVTPVSNHDSTTGWMSSSGSVTYTATGGLSSDNVGVMTGTNLATIEYSISGMNESDLENNPSFDLVFRTIIKDYPTPIESTITINLIKKPTYWITYHDEMNGIEFKESYPEDTVFSSSLHRSMGNNFQGWYLDPFFNTVFDYGTIITTDLDIYARYVYLVSFDNMDGTGTKLYISAEVNGAILTESGVPKPVRVGYRFDGWYKDVEYNDVWDYLHDMISSDVTLYAKWSGMEVRVEFVYGSVHFAGDEDIHGKVGDGDYVIDNINNDIIYPTVRIGSYFDTVDHRQSTPGNLVTILDFAQDWAESPPFESNKFICWYLTIGDEQIKVYSDTVLTVEMVNFQVIDQFSGFPVIVLHAETAAVAIELVMDPNTDDKSAIVAAPSTFYTYPTPIISLVGGKYKDQEGLEYTLIDATPKYFLLDDKKENQWIRYYPLDQTNCVGYCYCVDNIDVKEPYTSSEDGRNYYRDKLDRAYEIDSYGQRLAWEYLYDDVSESLTEQYRKGHERLYKLDPERPAINLDPPTHYLDIYGNMWLLDENYPPVTKEYGIVYDKSGKNAKLIKYKYGASGIEGFYLSYKNGAWTDYNEISVLIKDMSDPGDNPNYRFKDSNGQLFICIDADDDEYVDEYLDPSSHIPKDSTTYEEVAGTDLYMDFYGNYYDQDHEDSSTHKIKVRMSTVSYASSKATYTLFDKYIAHNYKLIDGDWVIIDSSIPVTSYFKDEYGNKYNPSTLNPLEGYTDKYFSFTYKLNEASRTGYKHIGWNYTNVPELHPAPGATRTMKLFFNEKAGEPSGQYEVYREILMYQDENGKYIIHPDKDYPAGSRPLVNDVSHPYNITYKALWEQRTYTVSIGDSAHGSITAFKVKTDGQREMITSGSVEVRYGDRIELSYSTQEPNYEFSRWSVSGDYILEDEYDPITTLVVTGNATVSVMDLGDKALSVHVYFDDSGLNSNDSARTTLYFRDAEGNYVYFIHDRSNRPFEIYKAYVPLGNGYVAGLKYESDEFGTQYYDMYGTIDVTRDSTAKITYDVISARINESRDVTGSMADYEPTVVNHIDHSDYPKGSIQNLTKYVGVLRTILENSEGLIINDPDNGLPPVFIYIPLGFEYVVYEGFPDEDELGHYFFNLSEVNYHRWQSNGSEGFEWKVSGVYTLPDNHFTAPAGKVFVGWAVKIGNAAPVTMLPGERIVVSENTIVKALWDTRVSSTVSFDKNGGTGNMPSVTAAGVYALPANSFTAPEGKAFVGWTVAGNLKNPGDRIDVTADTVITATWDTRTGYAITFDKGEGSGDMPTITNAPPYYYLPDNGFTAPEGKVFVGWSVIVGSEEPVTMLPGKKVVVTAATEITALWSSSSNAVVSVYADNGIFIENSREQFDLNWTRTDRPAEVLVHLQPLKYTVNYYDGSDLVYSEQVYFDQYMSLDVASSKIEDKNIEGWYFKPTFEQLLFKVSDNQCLDADVIALLQDAYLLDSDRTIRVYCKTSEQTEQAITLEILQEDIGNTGYHAIPGQGIFKIKVGDVWEECGTITDYYFKDTEGNKVDFDHIDWAWAMEHGSVVGDKFVDGYGNEWNSTKDMLLSYRVFERDSESVNYKIDTENVFYKMVDGRWVHTDVLDSYHYLDKYGNKFTVNESTGVATISETVRIYPGAPILSDILPTSLFMDTFGGVWSGQTGWGSPLWEYVWYDNVRYILQNGEVLTFPSRQTTGISPTDVYYMDENGNKFHKFREIGPSNLYYFVLYEFNAEKRIDIPGSTYKYDLIGRIYDSNGAIIERHVYPGESLEYEYKIEMGLSFNTILDSGDSEYKGSYPLRQIPGFHVKEEVIDGLTWEKTGGTVIGFSYSDSPVSSLITVKYDRNKVNIYLGEEVSPYMADQKVGAVIDLPSEYLDKQVLTWTCGGRVVGEEQGYKYTITAYDNGDLRFEPAYDVVHYSVTFITPIGVYENGLQTIVVEVEKGHTVASPVISGYASDAYTFKKYDGWNPTDIIDRDVTAVAQWDVVRYAFTFSTDGSATASATADSSDSVMTERTFNELYHHSEVSLVVKVDPGRIIDKENTRQYMDGYNYYKDGEGHEKVLRISGDDMFIVDNGSWKGITYRMIYNLYQYDSEHIVYDLGFVNAPVITHGSSKSHDSFGNYWSDTDGNGDLLWYYVYIGDVGSPTKYRVQDGKVYVGDSDTEYEGPLTDAWFEKDGDSTHKYSRVTVLDPAFYIDDGTTFKYVCKFSEVYQKDKYGNTFIRVAGKLVNNYTNPQYVDLTPYAIIEQVETQCVLHEGYYYAISDTSYEHQIPNNDIYWKNDFGIKFVMKDGKYVDEYGNIFSSELEWETVDDYYASQQDGEHHHEDMFWNEWLDTDVVRPSVTYVFLVVESAEKIYKGVWNVSTESYDYYPLLDSGWGTTPVSISEDDRYYKDMFGNKFRYIDGKMKSIGMEPSYLTARTLSNTNDGLFEDRLGNLYDAETGGHLLFSFVYDNSNGDRYKIQYNTDGSILAVYKWTNDYWSSYIGDLPAYHYEDSYGNEFSKNNLGVYTWDEVSESYTAPMDRHYTRDIFGKKWATWEVEYEVMSNGAYRYKFFITDYTEIKIATKLSSVSINFKVNGELLTGNSGFVVNGPNETVYPAGQNIPQYTTVTFTIYDIENSNIKWFTDPSFQHEFEATYNPDTKTYTYLVKENITLYTYNNMYEIFFHDYDGSNTRRVEQKVVNNAIVIPDIKYSLKDYIFVGWAKDNIGGRVYQYVPVESVAVAGSSGVWNLYAYYLKDGVKSGTYDGSNFFGSGIHKDQETMGSIGTAVFTVRYSDVIPLDETNWQTEAGHDELNIEDAGDYIVYYYGEITSSGTNKYGFSGSYRIDIGKRVMFVIAPSVYGVEGEVITASKDDIKILSVVEEDGEESLIEGLPTSLEEKIVSIFLDSPDGDIYIHEPGTKTLKVRLVFVANEKLSNYEIHYIDGSLVMYSKDAIRYESAGVSS